MKSGNKVRWKSIFNLKSILFTLAGVLCGVVALKGFMIPNHFLDGGVTGASILLEDILGIHISVLMVVFNVPFLIIGYKKIGKTFSIHSALAILLLAVLLFYIEIPTVTSDKVLIAAFGGFLIGLGIGLVIRGGGIIDGLEIIADYTHKKSGFTTSEIILVFNSVIILAVAYEYGIETGMYSILTYFTAMKTSDYVVDGFEQFTALNIISKKPEVIKDLLVEKLNKGITVYKGKRGFLPGSFEKHLDCDIIVTIVTRLEVYNLEKKILNEDPEAFLFVQSIKEVKGGVHKATVGREFKDEDYKVTG